MRALQPLAWVRTCFGAREDSVGTGSGRSSLDAPAGTCAACSSQARPVKEARITLDGLTTGEPVRVVISPWDLIMDSLNEQQLTVSVNVDIMVTGFCTAVASAEKVPVDAAHTPKPFGGNSPTGTTRRDSIDELSTVLGTLKPVNAPLPRLSRAVTELPRAPRHTLDFNNLNDTRHYFRAATVPANSTFGFQLGPDSLCSNDGPSSPGTPKADCAFITGCSPATP